jgi:catechol 2,3-dioxygenase-like lactoylglutathione lyase family enzyme
MLDHVSIGIADIDRSKAFYDAVLDPLGYKLLSGDDSSLGYGGDQTFLWLLKVERPVKPDMGSGLHFCFRADSRDGVRAFHAAALKLGGSDNGKAGLREDYGAGYFAAFVIDPDGYRLEAYCSR